MDILDFAYNWNNKINCKVFTTLRLHNENKYFIGNKFEIHLKKQFVKKVEVISVKAIFLTQINDFIAGIDTGYSTEECRDIIYKMYKNKNLDWNIQKMDFILLKEIK